MTSPKPDGRDRRSFLTRVAAGILGTGAVQIGKGTSAVSAWTGRSTNSVLNQARPVERSELKIATVEPYIMRFGRDGEGHPRGQFCLLCRIETRDGYVGWGEGTNFPKVATIATEIEMVRPLVVGQSAWNIEKIWYTIYRGRNAMHGSAVQSAISAIDIALWDIVGQKLGVPVHKLLGGKINDRLKIYTSFKWGNIPRTADAYAKRTKELVAKGALAGKWDPFFNDPNEINLVGTDYNLPRQATFNVGTAVRIAKAIEPYAPMFLEEPVPPEDVDAMLAVQRATSVPIAAGERLKSRLQARDYIEREAIRLYQPDAARIGGITEFRKACAMAENHFIPVAPHNPNGPVCLAAHLQACCTLANFVIFEQGDTDPTLCRELFGEWEDSWAYFPVPEGPGLGLRLTPDVVRRYSVDIKTAERGD
jgi:galactonate dehydratase